jgi:hypothetical protein
LKLPKDYGYGYESYLNWEGLWPHEDYSARNPTTCNAKLILK